MKQSLGTPSATGIKWEDLVFEYRPTNFMFQAHVRLDETADAGRTPEQIWSNRGQIVKLKPIALSPAAAVLNYAQAVFEGMKAVRTPAGKIVLFRPEANAQRFEQSASRLCMPPYPSAWFVEEVERLVRKESALVPPYHEPHWPKTCPPGSRSLYIRPVMIGSGPMLGVNPAQECTFYIFVSPVGVYRKAGPLLVLDSTHRAPAHGTGHIKTAANYPGTLYPMSKAKELRDDSGAPYIDVLYLDARHDRFVEEVGSSNFFALMKDGTLVTPQQGSILPGITRDSVMTIARDLLGWQVVERPIAIEEVLDDADEAFFTGTAATIVPITAITYNGKTYRLPSTATSSKATADPGSKAEMLKEQLQAIQTQRAADPFNWVHVVTP